MSGNESDGLTLADMEVIKCPHASYRRLQATAPVFLDPRTGYYEVTRHEEVRAILMDNVNYSNNINLQNSRPEKLQREAARLYREEGFPFVPALLNNDPPLHRSVRTMVDKAFMPARIAVLQPAILAEVTRLLDQFINRGQIEFVEEFAVPLPVNLIADQIGVPRAERKIIKEGSDALLATANPLSPDDELLEKTRLVIRMQRLIAECIHKVRAEPNETLLSVVVNSSPGRAADMPLLISIFSSLLVAGNETTAHALSNAVHHLARHPEWFDWLRQDTSRARLLVEESLRLMPPGQGFYRVAARDVEVAGTRIPKGAIVVTRRAAADIDETVFSDGTTFNPERAHLDRHLAFGTGPHFCIGHLLARNEMRISIEQLALRITRMTVADQPDAYIPHHGFLDSGVTRLRLVFVRASQAAGPGSGANRT